MRKAFKIACLAYKPNEVKFKNYSFTRKTLIDLNNQMLLNMMSKF